MGSEWDAQKLFDQYIHDYMIRKNMHTAAETFAAEANVSREPLRLNPEPEGFMAEWWSIFWPIFSSTHSNNPNATEDNSSSMASNVTFQNELPEFPNPQETFNRTMATTMMPMPHEPNPNGFGTNPFDVRRRQSISNFVAARTQGRQHIRPPAARNMNSNLHPPVVDQLNNPASVAAEPIAHEPYFINPIPEPSETGSSTPPNPTSSNRDTHESKN